MNIYNIVIIRDKPEEIKDWQKTLNEQIIEKTGHIDLDKLKQMNIVLTVNTEIKDKEANLANRILAVLRSYFK